MRVTLVFCPGSLLADRSALRELVTNYHKLPGRTLLVHTGTTDDPDQTAFETKRLSGSLSEEMVPNSGFSGSQRSFFQRIDSAYIVRRDLLEALYQVVDCVVLNTLATGPAGVHLAPPLELLPYLRDQVNCIDCRILPQNPRTALVAEPRTLTTAEEYTRLLAAFDEERETLALASALQPATLVSTRNFYQEAPTADHA